LIITWLGRKSVALFFLGTICPWAHRYIWHCMNFSWFVSSSSSKDINLSQ
jgi:hypothetical protein